MDEAEAIVGMSDDDSTSASGNGENLDGTAENSDGNLNGSGDEMVNSGLEDGVGDEDEDDEDDEDSIHPVSAASALSELVGSVGGVVVGLSTMDASQNHHHQVDNASGQCAPTRYLQVEGFDGRRNDIVYCKPWRTLHKNAASSLGSTNADNADKSASSTESTTEKESQAKSQTEGEEDEDKSKLMLFFGGDIQDFPEMMEQHRDHRNYVQFNLEATAMQLQKQFPDHHIAVIRPSRIQMLTFSCYDNFVHCNHTGAPEHVITHHSLHHLELLLQNLSKRIANNNKDDSTENGEEMSTGDENGVNSKNPENNSKDDDAGEKPNCNNGGEDSTVSSTTIDEQSSASSAEGGETSSASPARGGPNSSTSTNGTTEKIISKSKANAKILRLDRAAISVVGFSKGCVVLNQLLYEFHYLKTLTPDDLSMDDFLHCIKDMYWLDGGHNGGKNTWITSRSLLETLTRLGIRIHVHLTPYQLLDDRRPWIRKEEKLFSELLKKFSAPIVRQIHFENEPASLQQHLRIIGDFHMRPSHITSSLLQRGADGIVGGLLDGTEENHKPIVVGEDADDGDTLHSMD